MTSKTLAEYQQIADALNHDFRTVLHADATEVGVSISPIRSLDLRRLAMTIEFSRIFTTRKLTLTVTECGIICVR